MEAMEARMDALPNDVLLGMVQLLPIRDVVSCLGVCKRWRKVILDAKWKEIHVAFAGGEDKEGREERRMTARFAANRQPALAAPHVSWPSVDPSCVVPRCGSIGEPVDECIRSILCAGLHLRWRKEQIHSACLMYTSLGCEIEPGGHPWYRVMYGDVDNHGRVPTRFSSTDLCFSASLPIHLSFQHHYGRGDGGGRGRGGGGDSRRRSSNCVGETASTDLSRMGAETSPSSGSSSNGCRITKLLHAAVRGANEWNPVPYPSRVIDNDARCIPFITDVRVSNKYALVRASPIAAPCVIELNVREQMPFRFVPRDHVANGGMNASRTASLSTPKSLRNRSQWSYWGAMAIAAPLLAASVNEGIAVWKIIPREDVRTWRELVRPDGNVRPGERRIPAGREQVNGGGGDVLQLSAPTVLCKFTGTSFDDVCVSSLLDSADSIICLECTALGARPPCQSSHVHGISSTKKGPHDAALKCHDQPMMCRWRVVSGSAAGRVAQYTLYDNSADVVDCDSSSNADGREPREGATEGGELPSPLYVESSSTIDLDVSCDGVPTALEVFPDSERVAVGTSLGTVLILSIVSAPSLTAGETSFLRQASFMTLPTPIVQVKLCATGGALSDSLVVLNHADPLCDTACHTAFDKGKCAAEPAVHGAKRDVPRNPECQVCQVCEAIFTLRQRCRGACSNVEGEDDVLAAGFDGLESLWPKLATKKLTAMARARNASNSSDSENASAAATASSSDFLHNTGNPNDEPKHCVSTLSMWYEGAPGSWSPSWSRFVPVSQSISTWSESFIVVSGVAATLFIDGNGRLLRKLPNHEVDMWTVESNQSRGGVGLDLNGGKSKFSHLKGAIVSCHAWCVGTTGSAHRRNATGGVTRPGDFQLVSATEIEFDARGHRTLSIHLHAPEVYGSLVNIVCGCGEPAVKQTVVVNDRDQKSLFNRSLRCVYCCPRVLPSKKRRCDFMCLH